MAIEKQGNEQGPLERTKKFLQMLPVAALASMGTPQSANAQNSTPDMGALFGEMGKTFDQMRKLFGEMARENAAELQKAKELGPEVEKAFLERQQILDLLANSKTRLQRLERTLEEAREIEVTTDPIKGDLEGAFKEMNKMLPAAFIRQAPATIERLKETIRIQEEQFKLAGDHYFSLLEDAEKRSKGSQ